MTLCRVLFSVCCVNDDDVFVFIKPEKSTHSQLNGATVKILYDNKFCFVFYLWLWGERQFRRWFVSRDIICLGIIFVYESDKFYQQNKKGLISNWSISDFTFPRLHTLTFMLALFAYHIFCCVHLLYTRANNTLF